jgi:hypothetical protein
MWNQDYNIPNARLTFVLQDTYETTKRGHFSPWVHELFVQKSINVDTFHQWASNLKNIHSHWQ